MDFLVLIGSIITVLGTIYVQRITQNTKLARERLDKVYDPLLLLFGNSLYQYNINFTSTKKFKKIKKIIKHYRTIGGNYLYNSFERFSKNPCEDTYKKFCSTLITHYNDICKILKLPEISISYRLKNGWYYKNEKIWLIILKICNQLQTICIIMLILIVYYLLIRIKATLQK